MLVEVAKPVTLISCILSLYAVFHTAFLAPSSDMHERIYHSLGLLVLAAAISLISGLVFRTATEEWGPSEAQQARGARLTSTLPVQTFFWASSAMLVLFVVSWYLESHCIFYRDVRF
jgi:hypothetical protein